MASGHANRTQRPNTWLHRPSLQREDCPCQPGAVHTWHIVTLPRVTSAVATRVLADIVGSDDRRPEFAAVQFREQRFSMRLRPGRLAALYCDCGRAGRCRRRPLDSTLSDVRHI